MMRNLLAIAIVFGLALPSAGCLVRERTPNRHHHVKQHKKGCGPAHHWNGYACVHNGKAKGHHKK